MTWFIGIRVSDVPIIVQGLSSVHRSVISNTYYSQIQLKYIFHKLFNIQMVLTGCYIMTNLLRWNIIDFVSRHFPNQHDVYTISYMYILLLFFVELFVHLVLVTIESDWYFHISESLHIIIHKKVKASFSKNLKPIV